MLNIIDIIMEASAVSHNEQVDKWKLTAIFPNEVWLLISSLTEDTSELIQLTLASLFWRNLLKPKRQQYMFPEVLVVLEQQNIVNQKHCRKDLLPFRLVCKSWKNGVDHLLERKHDTKFLSSDHFYGITHYLIGCNLCYPIHFRIAHKRGNVNLALEQITSRLASSTVQTPNPFPGRVIIITEKILLRMLAYPMEGNDKLNQNRIITERFLKVAGHHFWYAYIYCGSDGDMTTSEWYKLLCKYVRLLPNLKSLYIKCCCNDRSLVSGERNFYNFPKLNKLELVSVEGPWNCVINSIFRANPQIEVLICRNGTMYRDDGKMFPEADNQVELEYSLVKNPHTVSIGFPCVQHFAIIPSGWFIRVLRIEFGWDRRGDWEVIFQKLENYKNTLTELLIQFPQWDEQYDNLNSPQRKLDMPKVTRFEAVAHKYPSLDFLLGLLSLETLELDICGCCDDIDAEFGREGCKIDLSNAFSEEFMQSNIWTLIPTLVSVHLNRWPDRRSHRRV